MTAPLINPPAERLGREHAILRGRAQRYGVHFTGPLSLKAVIRGSAAWEMAAGRFEMSPGAVLIVNDGEEYAITIDALQPVETFCVFFARGFVEDACRSMLGGSAALLDRPDAAPVHFSERLQHAGPLTAMIEEMRQEATEGGLVRLAEVLVRAQCDVAARVERLPALRAATRVELHRRVQRGVEFMHANFSKPIALAGIATAAALSPFHFHRLFSAIHGLPPHRYLTRLRLAHARSLLRMTDRSMAEIALACGFESATSFSSLFKRATGVPPARFRKNEEAPGSPAL
jgi:AraC family transcriptional regulator